MNDSLETTSPAAEPTPTPTPTLAYATHRDEASSGWITCGDVAFVLVKVFGFYVLLEALPYVGRVLGDIVEMVSGARLYFGRAIATATPAAFLVGVGIFLPTKTTMIARWFMPRTAVAADGAQGPLLAQFQAIAFSVVGLVLVIRSVPPLVWILVDSALNEGGGTIRRAPFARFSDVFPTWVHYAIEAALGLWLFFGSKSLAAWWWRLRHPEYGSAEDAIHDARAATEAPSTGSSNPHEERVDE